MKDKTVNATIPRPLKAGDGVCKTPRLSPASPVPGASIAAAVVPAFIEGRVEGVEVPAVQMILHDSESFAESLEMHDLSGAEKFDGIVDVRVVFDKAENVVVSDPGFLFWHDCVKTTTLETRINTRYFFVLAFSGCNFVRTT